MATWKQWLRYTAMRTSVRWTTASQTKTGTTRTTISSPSTTPMTTLTHCTCTSTEAWRTCTESARIFVHSCWWLSHIHSWLKSWALSHSIHGHPHGAPSFTRLSTFYFFLFLLSVPVFLFHLELFPELLYTKCMANNLRCSAAEESEGTLNVFHSLTNNGACRKHTLSRDEDVSEPVGWIRGFTKIGPIIQIKGTYCSEQYGMEIQVDSMLNSGSLSWIVISRGPNRYVMKSMKKKKSLPWRIDGKYREIDRDKATGTIEPTGESSFQDIDPDWSTEAMSFQLGQSRRRWQQCFDIEVFIENMTERSIGALCHPCYAAISKMKVLEIFRVHSGWVLYVEEVKTRFQYCLDSNENLINTRANQGHSGGALVDPALPDNVEMLLGW